MNFFLTRYIYFNKMWKNLGGSLLYKKWALSMILICALSMTGCIVINTGEDDGKTVENSTTNKTTKEVIIEKENSSNNNSNNNAYSRAYEVDEYVFYDSDRRYLTNADLSSLSNWGLKLARNEIYARHGRLFKDSSLQSYFNSCSWYNGYISPDDFDDDSLNSIEVYNIKLIRKYE